MVGVDELIALALLLYRYGHLLGLVELVVIVYEHIYGLGLLNLRSDSAYCSRCLRICSVVVTLYILCLHEHCRADEQ